MGAGMARNLARRGHAVAAYDLSKAALEGLGESGARFATSAADAARGADFVITMLPNSKAVADVLFGSGAVAEHLGAGTLVIDMSTGATKDAIAAATKLAERGIAFIDAPVGRTPWDADAGTLLILVGGDADDVNRAKPILACMGNEIIHAGPVGSGTRLKLVNNYMTVVGSALVAETLALGAKVGLDRDLTVRVLQSTVAGKGPLNVLYPKKVLAHDTSPLFSGRLAQKDLLLAIDLADSTGTHLALGAAARDLYAQAERAGMLDRDMTALLEVLEANGAAGEEQLHKGAM
jgi:4-hydroxybutyrate dehydrogenase/sulfolactaldehyde 3-reductase